MKQSQDIIRVETKGQGLYDITHNVQRWLLGESIDVGLLTVYCRHTSASLTIQENADPDVRRDLLTFFKRLAPEDRAAYTHRTEGPDDMPAHIRAALTLASLSIPVSSGRMTLGTWQGLYLFEHRDSPHTRTLMLHLIGGVTLVPGARAGTGEWRWRRATTVGVHPGRAKRAAPGWRPSTTCR